MILMTFLNTLAFLIPAIILLFIVKDKKFRYKLIATIVIFELLNYAYVYFFLPSRNLLSIITYNVIVLVMLVIILIFIGVLDEDEYDNKGKAYTKGVTVVVLVGVVVAVLGSVHSHLSVKPTYDSIQVSKAKISEAPTFKKGETPVAIAPATVLNRVHKSISDLPNSQYYNVSDQVQAQYYKGKPVYIIPVEYDGFWAMQKSYHEIPGYFVIDATKQNATPHFVHVPYKYAVSAYFGHDVSRQLYRHNPEWLKLGDSQASLEIDNRGKPYWVQTVYKSQAFSHRINYKQLHVVVMNAQTGSIKTYTLNNLPSWIDEGITSDVASQMNHDFGYYSHGYWNKYFGKTGIKKPTNNGPEDGVTSVFDTNGQIHYFTDFTNPNSSDSALGYSMINARTGKLDYYHTSGIMDSDGAKKNANQNYRAQKWHASMPIIYNVSGKPTWVMNILDDTKAIRGYYYLDASDQSVYAYGSSVNSTLESYLQAIVNNGGVAGNTVKSSTKAVSGTVDRVALVSSKNKVMFTLNGSNIVYTVDTDDFNNANLLRTGDQVSFKARVSGNLSVGNIKSFKNNSLK